MVSSPRADLAEVRHDLSVMYQQMMTPKGHPPPEALELATMVHRLQLVAFNRWKLDQEEEGVKDAP